MFDPNVSFLSLAQLRQTDWRVGRKIFIIWQFCSSLVLVEIVYLCTTFILNGR